MKKIIATLLLTASITSISYAAEKYDTKALRVVQKQCTSCHGTPFYMAKQIDDEDWEFYFETEGKLEKLHKGNDKGLAAIKNPLFHGRKDRILKFFIDNSKYSGSVNGCDANFCGTVK
ncbi:hypothetical protein [Sulfurovum sp.]|uniref:hypothetical protein n=1 Tax=Sulfurovum sp. TaxID=1969726 RepID=UPI002867C604|nr:hypothetical protein [Sulfurovum sp.]